MWGCQSKPFDSHWTLCWPTADVLRWDREASIQYGHLHFWVLSTSCFGPSTLSLVWIYWYWRSNTIFAFFSSPNWLFQSHWNLFGWISALFLGVLSGPIRVISLEKVRIKRHRRFWSTNVNCGRRKFFRKWSHLVTTQGSNSPFKCLDGRHCMVLSWVDHFA